MSLRDTPKPNFFILGAGRCGTTSLKRYLAGHPEVYMSRLKEPSFWNDGTHNVSDPIAYLELFRDVRDEKVIGEASHMYLTSPASAPALKAFFPEAKFALILRNPVDRAASLHRLMTAGGHEWIHSFERALAAEAERARSVSFRVKNAHYYNTLYFESGLYGRLIQRYLEYFPREQFVFLTLDELKRDGAAVLERVFRFLEIDTAYRPDLVAHNHVAPVRSARAQYFLQHGFSKLLKRLGIPKRRKIVRRLLELNCSPEATPVVRAETRRRLAERYLEDICLTERLTGLDLGAWKPETAVSHASQEQPSVATATAGLTDVPVSPRG